MSAELSTAYFARRRAHNELVEILARDYPSGARVRWKRKGHCHSGVVIQAARSSERLVVRNEATAKCSWISAWDIIEAMD